MPSFFEKLKKGMNIDVSSLNLKMDNKNPISAEKPKKKAALKINKKTTAPVKKPAAGEDKLMPKNKTDEKEVFKTKIEVKTEDKKKDKENLKEIPPSDATPPSKDSWFEPEGQLVVDVYETDGEIVIQSAIAGVKPEEIDIDIENDVVRIRGERKRTMEEKDKNKNYFYQECYWGKFSREIILPAEVDGSHAKAQMKDGILTISIPKIEREKKRKIVIK